MTSGRLVAAQAAAARVAGGVPLAPPVAAAEGSDAGPDVGVVAAAAGQVGVVLLGQVGEPHFWCCDTPFVCSRCALFFGACTGAAGKSSTRNTQTSPRRRESSVAGG